MNAARPAPRLRVALVDPSLFTWPYDAALAQALNARGHQAAIYGSASRLPAGARTGGLLRDHFYRELADPRLARLKPRLRLAAKGLAHTAGLWRLVRRLRRQAPDVIHFQWTALPAVDLLFLPALRRIAPLVLTVHDSTPFNGNPSSGLQDIGARAIQRHFDHLIVHTRAAALSLCAEGIDPSRLSLLPHGPLSASALPRPAHDGPVRLLFFGKLKPYKGLDVLIQALSGLRRGTAQWRLRIVGEPCMDLRPLEDLAVRGGIAERIDFELRFVPDPEVPELLADADLAVLPYRHIDASGVLMQVVAAGLPVVASRLGNFDEMLEDGRHGRLVRPGDVPALAAALAELIDDPAQRIRMSAAMQALSGDLPPWELIAARTARVYASLSRQARHAAQPDTHGVRA